MPDLPPSLPAQAPQEELSLRGWRRWARWRFLAAASLLGVAVAVAALAGLVMAYSQDLPVVPGPDNLMPSLATKIYDINGQLITQLAIENRTLIRLDQAPKHLVNAIIALEDRRFMSHWGVDPWGILRAGLVNLKAGRNVEGGSTITQQLAKNLFLTREKTFRRKLKEALLALQIEKSYTKTEILEMYFNQVYFGNGAYGAEAAARAYFGKHVGELSLGECAMMAGVPRSPNKNNPIDDVKMATLRRDTALNSMLEVGSITQEEHDAAVAEAITVFQADPVVAAYFVEYVRQQLETTYGSNAVYKGGLSVYTTLDLRLQDIAQRASEKGAREADLKAAPFLEHDFRLAEKPVLQVAFLAMDPRSGHIRAMVGGRDFKRYQFNRATQAQRQPGSAFKPFVYTTAIEAGFTPADIIDDSPVVYSNGKDEGWKPENFDKEFKGPVTLRKALYESRNVVTVKLLEKLGSGVMANTALRMGISSRLNRDLSVGLGTSEVNLLEMVNGYATLANQGVRVEPVGILSVRDSAGKLLEETQPRASEALSPAVAYVVTSMLQDVIERGTASHLRTALGFTRIAAGKTGTTSDFSDAWFMGYTPDLVAGCWFGYDQRRRIGKLLTGGTIAAPVWADFMTQALAGTPSRPFPVPAGVKFSRICADNGKAASKNCRRIIDEAFVDGTELQQVDVVDDNNQDLQNFYEQDLKGAPSSTSGQAQSVSGQGPSSVSGQGLSGAAKLDPDANYPSDGSAGF